MQDRRFGSRGPCRTRHLAPSAFRTLSTLYTLRPLPGLFHPGNAHGVRVFRALYFPGKPPPLSRPGLLSCRSADRARSPCGERARDARLQSLHPPGESRHAGRNPRGRCPPDVRPSRDLRARVVGRICTGREALQPLARPDRPRLAAGAAADPPLAPLRFRPSGTTARATGTDETCAPERCPPRELAFPPRGGAGPLGVPHLVHAPQVLRPGEPGFGEADRPNLVVVFTRTAETRSEDEVSPPIRRSE
jgi:hypothetical protein